MLVPMAAIQAGVPVFPGVQLVEAVVVVVVQQVVPHKFIWVVEAWAAEVRAVVARATPPSQVAALAHLHQVAHVQHVTLVTVMAMVKAAAPVAASVKAEEAEVIAKPPAVTTVDIRNVFRRNDAYLQ